MASERYDIIIQAKGAKQAAAEIRTIGAASKSTVSSLGLLKGALGGLAAGFGAAGLVGAIKSTITTAAAFEKQVAALQNVTGSTDAQIQPLLATIKELGATTQFSATQAAEGAEFLARAGFSVQETIAGLGPTLQLATAESLNLGRAADIVSNILSTYGENADQTGRVTDVLAKISQNANTNVLQLGQAFSFAGPVAKAVGVSIEETAGALGVLGNAGIQATRGGTALRAIFNELNSAGGELSIETRGLSAVLQTLEGQQLSLADANDLVGKRFGGVLINLVNNRQEYERLTTAAQNAQGTVAAGAERLANTVDGAWKRIISATEALQLSFFNLNGSAPVLIGFLNGIATAIGRLATFVEQNRNAIFTWVSTFAQVIGAVGGFRLAITAAGLALRVFTGLLLANPFTALLVGIASVISTIQVLRQNFAGLSEPIQQAINFITGFGSQALSVFNSILTGIGSLIPGFTDLGSVAQNAGQLIAMAFNFFLNSILPNIIGALGAAGTAFQNLGVIGANVGNAIIQAMNVALQGVQNLVNGVVAGINRVSSALASISGGAVGGGQLGEVNFGQIGEFQGGGQLQSITAGFNSAKVATQQWVQATTELGAKINNVKTVTETAKPAVEGLKVETGGAADNSNKLAEAADKAGSASKNLGKSASEGAKGVKKLGDAAAESSSFIEDAFKSAFDKASDAIAEFVATGKLDIKSLTQSILKDITKMALNSVFKQVFGGGGGGGGIFGGGGGGGGIFGGLFGGGGGGGGILGGLFGFAEGGSFTIGGTGGTDNNVMSINGRPVARVSRGEMVTVSPNGQGGGGGGRPIVINYNISTPDANSFRRSQGQIQANAAATINRASRRNN
jgi:TP901 family phage tail tape measure protein